LKKKSSQPQQLATATKAKSWKRHYYVARWKSNKIGQSRIEKLRFHFNGM